MSFQRSLAQVLALHINIDAHGHHGDALPAFPDVLHDMAMTMSVDMKDGTLSTSPSCSSSSDKYELMDDYAELAAVVEALEEWLRAVAKRGDAVDVDYVKRFLWPTAMDVKSMNVELMSAAGLGGAYEAEMMLR